MKEEVDMSCNLGIPPRTEGVEEERDGQQALDYSPTEFSEINTVFEFWIDSKTAITRDDRGESDGSACSSRSLSSSACIVR